MTHENGAATLPTIDARTLTPEGGVVPEGQLTRKQLEVLYDHAAWAATVNGEIVKDQQAELTKLRHELVLREQELSDLRALEEGRDFGRKLAREAELRRSQERIAEIMRKAHELRWCLGNGETYYLLDLLEHPSDYPFEIAEALTVMSTAGSVDWFIGCAGCDKPDGHETFWMTRMEPERFCECPRGDDRDAEEIGEGGL